MNGQTTLDLGAEYVGTFCPVCAGPHPASSCHAGQALTLDLEPSFAARLVIIVPCSADKAPGLLTATGELHTAGTRYTGQFHRYARQHAARLGADVVILSALFGLVPLDRPIPDYNTQLGDPGSITDGAGPRRLADQAAHLGLLDPGTRVVAFCPNRYAAVAAAVIPDLANPLAGAAGIGEQRGRIAHLTRLELVR